MKIIAINSASNKINNPDELQKDKIRNKTECTGLRALITIIADNNVTAPNK